MATVGKAADVAEVRPAHGGAHRHRDSFIVGGLAAVTLASVGIAIDVSRPVRMQPAPLVALSPITRGRVVGAVRANGIVSPSELATVSQTISGRLTRINVKAGEHVVAGQVLARFDSLALQADLARAEARAVSAEVAALEAEVQLIRHRMRQSSGYLGPEAPPETETAGEDELVMARAARAAAEVEASEAAFRLARNRLRQGIVRAPISGLIMQRHHNEGDVVNAGAVLLTIASEANPPQIEAAIPEWSSGGIAVGQKVDVTVPAFPGRRFTGEVQRLLPVTGTEGDRRLPVVLKLKGPADGLRVGMTAAVTIRTGDKPAVVRVPSAALVFAPRGTQAESESPAVWMASETSQQLRQVPVEVGAMDGAFAEVRGEGLREGGAVAIGYVTAK
ncbi:MAG TPA: efflux RND transporter periplasmic adaptor subunit [Polyangia bacterium]